MPFPLIPHRGVIWEILAEPFLLYDTFVAFVSYVSLPVFIMIAKRIEVLTEHDKKASSLTRWKMEKRWTLLKFICNNSDICWMNQTFFRKGKW